MFDLKRIFGMKEEQGAVEAPTPEPASSTSETNEATSIPPVAIEEMVQAELEKLKQNLQTKQSEYSKFVEGMTSIEPPQPQEQKPIDFNNLPEDITVPQLAELILNEATRRLRQEMQAVLPKLNLAETIADKLIRKYPYLSTVRDEGVAILNKMPPEYLNEEAADWVLHALKGRRAEMEKEATVASLFEPRATSTPQPALQVSLEELNSMAEALGIPVETLKKGLLKSKT